MTLLAHCLARRFLRALQRLADEFGVAVVITNQVSALHTRRMAGRLGMEGAGWMRGRKARGQGLTVTFCPTLDHPWGRG